MIILGTQDGFVRFGRQKWWAERGLIHWEDQDSGDSGTVTVHDILLRIKAVNDMVGRSRLDRGIATHADQVAAYQRYIEEMIALCDKAQAQGRPELETHVAQLASERKSSSGLVVVPGLQSQL